MPSTPCHRNCRHSFITKLMLGSILLILLPSCMTVGPNYTPPKASSPDSWHSTMGQKGITIASTSADELAHWWTLFNDPVLTRLIAQATADNTDLRQAQARVRESRARRGISHARRFPTLTANGKTSKSQSSKETGSNATRELYSASFDAGWELDLFGGKRRTEEATQADLAASGEDLHDVLVSLLAEVARNYVELRSDQTKLNIAQKDIAAREESAALTLQRVTTGLAAQQEMEQAITSLEQARAQLPSLETNLHQTKNRLAVLLGAPPGSLGAELGKTCPIPTPPEHIVVGVPAEVLRHRPDVRRAERELAAQTARIGQATAALYPNFSLSGSIGLDAFTPARLFNSSARSSSAQAGISWSIFDFGAIRQNIEVQNARQEQALGKYEGTILSALAEVENAITAYANEQQRCQSLTLATASAQKSLQLAEQQYKVGLVNFFTVLDSQRTWLSLQNQLAGSHAAIATNLISLYKALGGGWTSLATTNKNSKQD